MHRIKYLWAIYRSMRWIKYRQYDDFGTSEIPKWTILLMTNQTKGIDSTDFDMLEYINKAVSIPNTYVSEEGTSEHIKIYENLIFPHGFDCSFTNFNRSRTYVFFGNQRIYGLQ